MILTAQQIEALHIMETVKFIATTDQAGAVNVAPIITTDHYKDDTLIFGDFLMWKTKQNLLVDPRVMILVVDPNLNYFKIKGTFLGFEEKGEAFETINSSPLFKYNAYTGARSAGLIQIDTITGTGQLNKLKMAAGQLASYFKKSDFSLNQVVMEKFSRLQALKALAWSGNHGPEIAPLTNIQVNGRAMTFANTECPERCTAALSVITMDPVTYQVKGSLENQKGKCCLKVEALYSGGLPNPGKRIL